MKKPTKATSSFDLSGRNTHLCSYCGRSRIDRYGKSTCQVYFDRVRTEDEFTDELKAIAAERDLNLVKDEERAFAMREVDWRPGDITTQVVQLCSRCFSKVRVCATCDLFGEHGKSGSKGIIFKCHIDHMTFTRGENIGDPHRHFCGEWSQAEPFKESYLLETLGTKDKANR
jgi:hypothetical protein